MTQSIRSQSHANAAKNGKGEEHDCSQLICCIFYRQCSPALDLSSFDPYFEQSFFPHKTQHSLGKFVRITLGYAQLVQPFCHQRVKLAHAFLLRNETAVKSCIALG